MDPSLAAVLDAVWITLAGLTPESPLRRATLATVDADGAPDARTVLLSAVGREPPRLYVDTDPRSAKFAELRRLPRAVLLFYFPDERTQLRFAGETRLHTHGTQVAAHWLKLGDAARLPYFTLHPPGTRAPLATADLPGGGSAAAPGAAHFAVIELMVRRLDWLHFAGHASRRALFEWDERGAAIAHWLVP